MKNLLQGNIYYSEIKEVNCKIVIFISKYLCISKKLLQNNFSI